jgi:hypothetical protein
MLFCVVSPLPGRPRHQLAQRRRAIVQLSLPLLETAAAVPEPHVWEALTPDQRAAVIELLGRLFAKAAVEAPSAAERRNE